MNLDELKQLAQDDEEVSSQIEYIYCEVCDRQRRQVVITYRKIQIRECEGVKNKKHTLYYDGLGKYLFAVEHHDGTVDWRSGFDHARTEGVSPQTRAWELDRLARRKGGRKKGGSGFTSYPDDDDDKKDKQ